MKTKNLAISSGIMLLALLGFPALSGAIEAASEPLVFATWDIFEVDKCASIWLIKRHIDPKSRILLYPRGEPIKEGIPFDTPEAIFRRYQNASTYETLMRHYKIKDGRLLYIARIVHDIEVNTWGKKVMRETWQVQNNVNKIISESVTSMDVIEKSLSFFDTFYSDLKQ